jgi:hypothetical protein
MSGAEQFGFSFDAPDAGRDIERCAAIARELAEKAGRAGLTMEDVRVVAVARGVLTGQETGRRLSWLGQVPKAAGLVSTGRRRYSKSRNPNVLFVLPEYASAAERAS